MASKVKLTTLKTVYPPISNQEAVWLANEKDVETHLRESDFYMIAARAEATFENIKVDEKNSSMELDFVVKGGPKSKVRIQLDELPNVKNLASFFVESGPKVIRIWDKDSSVKGAQVIRWFTTEKLLWAKSEGYSGIYGLENHYELSTYDLLYVGIAKVGDTFDRLIDKGHKARQTILSNEKQRAAGARVTDEIFLFMFKAYPLVISSFSAEDDFNDFDDFIEMPDNKKVIADAEKAFVSILKPEYNIRKFPRYPAGTDGLYNQGYERYGYMIGNNFVFNTPHGKFRGGWDAPNQIISNRTDMIMVSGDSVTFFDSSK